MAKKNCFSYLMPIQGKVLSSYDVKVLSKNLKQKFNFKLVSYYKNFVVLQELENA